ncbi:MAG: T9SS type A sorting domain-containing protein [Janthinobacterium lividum]
MQRTLTLPGTPWPQRAAAVLALLAAAASVQAQTYNTGAANISNSNLYTGGVFQNTTTGNFANSGSTVTYAGASAATFVNDGAYTAARTSSSAAVDQFVGPTGAAGPQEIAGSVAPAFYNLTLANGSGQAFTISNTQGLDVANLLTLQNGVTTTPTTVAGAIRLASGAAIAGTTPSTTTYINGYLAKAGTAAFTYVLGTVNTSDGNTTPVGAAIYSPITFSSPGGTAIRYLTGTPPNATVLATQAGGLQLTNVSSKEYYPIGTVGAASGSTITLPYGNFGATAAGAPYVSNPATLTIAAYNGTAWTNLSATTANSVNTTAKTVTVTLPTALSTSYTALALASATTAPLPVELVDFTAAKQGANGLLSWQTASEQNSAYFEVQASTDGRSWQALSQLAAAGASTGQQAYRYLDRTLARYGAPVVYYRLRQVDRDATAQYSAVVSLSPDALAWSLTAYPNPFATELNAELLSSETGPITAMLLDGLGRIVLRRELAGVAGRQLLDLDEAHTLPSGSYLLYVRQNSHTATVRLVRE